MGPQLQNLKTQDIEIKFQCNQYWHRKQYQVDQTAQK